MLVIKEMTDRNSTVSLQWCNIFHLLGAMPKSASDSVNGRNPTGREPELVMLAESTSNTSRGHHSGCQPDMMRKQKETLRY